MTNRTRGPIEMHHHRKPAPALTSEQRSVIAANRRAARDRRHGEPSVTAQVDPFVLAAERNDADPFAS
jgi:hypothetical protein